MHKASIPIDERRGGTRVNMIEGFEDFEELKEENDQPVQVNDFKDSQVLSSRRS